MKNPTIATLLNIIPGLGYIYLGGKKRIFGALLVAGGIASLATVFDPLFYDEEFMSAQFRIWDAFALFGMVLVAASFMYDAYVSANEYNDTKDK